MPFKYDARSGMLDGSVLPVGGVERPLAVYVHIPFCERKCDYCDFNSGVQPAPVRSRYVDALINEIVRSPISDRPVSSVFFGGGTPSVLPAARIVAILDALRSVFCIQPDAEITVECNPGTLASERLAGETTESFLSSLFAAGVNRLSFGVQSLDPSLLRVLGRIHSPEQALASIHAAQHSGFANINVDLMFALPGQSSAQWEDSLAGVIATGVPHISAYSLIVEPETPFHQLDAEGRLPRPGEDAEADMYETAIATLKSAGFEHYEVSAFAKPGHRCRHNLIYWHNGEYIGFGNGATSYVRGDRFKREPALETYMRLAETGKETIVEREALDRRGAMGETMMMGLRLLDGVDRGGFAARFGRDPVEEFASDVARLEAGGLLCVTDKAVALTHRGLFLANDVWEAFV